MIAGARTGARRPLERRKPRYHGASASTATGIRTRVSAMRGRRPSPLDDSGAQPTGSEASKALGAGAARPVLPRGPSETSSPIPRLVGCGCAIFACSARGCGGIGRRARFRSVSGQPGGGSSPLIRIEESACKSCVLSKCSLPLPSERAALCAVGQRHTSGRNRTRFWDDRLEPLNFAALISHRRLPSCARRRSGECGASESGQWPPSVRVGTAGELSACACAPSRHVVIGARRRCRRVRRAHKGVQRSVYWVR